MHFPEGDDPLSKRFASMMKKKSPGANHVKT